MKMKLENKMTIELSRSGITVRTCSEERSIHVRNRDKDHGSASRRHRRNGVRGGVAGRELPMVGKMSATAVMAPAKSYHGAVQRMAIPAPLAAAVPSSVQAWRLRIRIALVGAQGGNGAVHVGADVHGCG
jgi:hypothetical protein